MRFIGNVPLHDKAPGQSQDQYMREVIRLNDSYLDNMKETINYNARTFEINYTKMTVANSWAVMAVADMHYDLKALRARTITGSFSFNLWIAGARGLRIMEWDIGTGTPPRALSITPTPSRALATAYGDIEEGDQLLAIIGGATGSPYGLAITMRTG